MNAHKSFGVRTAILRAITSGKWRPGVPIPTEIEIAREFSVNVQLVRETLRRLEQEHVLTRQDRRTLAAMAPPRRA
jgi:DNA-binding GntR family transcriptional regulator